MPLYKPKKSKWKLVFMGGGGGQKAFPTQLELKDTPLPVEIGLGQISEHCSSNICHS